MNDLVNRAKEFSHAAHDSIGQKRKYGNLPYWTHTDAVADLVAEYGGGDIMIAVGYLHDVVEDVFPELYKQGRLVELANIIAVYQLFPWIVVEMVKDLTHVYTSEDYPQYNRKKRKAMEIDRLSKIRSDSKTIKIADIIHNTETISDNDPDFAKVYLDEKLELLNVLKTKDNGMIWRVAYNQVSEAKNKVNTPPPKGKGLLRYIIT